MQRPTLFLAALLVSAACGTACTTRTIVSVSAGDASAVGPDEGAGSDEDEEAPTAPANADAGSRSKPGSRPTSKDGGASSGTEGGSSGPVMTGGSITLTCPPSGFHQKPPITISSVPKTLLPRCSAATKTCWLAASTNAAIDACLAADTTPAAMLDDEPLDCAGCERAQGAYCMASACPSQFGAYGCCAQSNGDAACGTELNAVIACAGTTGKAAFNNCLAGLVTQCFP